MCDNYEQTVGRGYDLSKLARAMQEPDEGNSICLFTSPAMAWAMGYTPIDPFEDVNLHFEQSAEINPHLERNQQ